MMMTIMKAVFLLGVMTTVCSSFVVPSKSIPSIGSISTRTEATAYAPLSLPSSSRRKGEPPESSSSTSLFGIPKMFRWLTDQYPEIVSRQLEKGLGGDDVSSPDHFYLDMNGIIHPATHGNDKSGKVILDETAMFKKIFLYVDRLYKLVRPKKVLYLAVDGVAPRAKMNQQRSRRFRAAKEAEVAAAEATAQSQAKGGKSILPEILTDGSVGKRFDSNCITPGTDFMLKLSLAMQKWVAFKVETDPFWSQSGCEVIISGPDVPGEGEHKVMDHIRKYQNLHAAGADFDSQYYAPGDTHVLYGLDADLIMLGLATHEKKFMLLREKMSVVMAGRGGGNRRRRGRYRNTAYEQRKPKDMLEYNENDFELLEITSLRQMLSIQFRRFADAGVLEKEFSLNRIIDDFIFMCMLVGNDFLPHCPHLQIDTGAISMMMSTYIELLPDWGDYLTKSHKIHPDRLEEFIYHLAVYEEEYFKRRGMEENEPGWLLSADNEEEALDFYGTFYSGQATPAAAAKANDKLTGDQNVPAAETIPMAPTGNRAFRRAHPDSMSRSYRDFYYEDKMGWPVEDRSRTLFRRRGHVRDYLEGLHWVLLYYHSGCPSWDWYFPHMYSPLATDMVNLKEFYQDLKSAERDEEGFCSFLFPETTPFPSLAQLLAVLPPQSAELLPPALGELMLHEASPIKHFYPPDFTNDPNGKRQPWEAVVQIPFIDGQLLLETVQQILDKDAAAVVKESAEKQLLTNGERRRNVPGKDHFFRPPKQPKANGTTPKTVAAATKKPAKRKPRSPRSAATKKG